ncbi:hypothetical protein KKA39_00025 [Patescibacteria group bacterium]|nr:hypothetical protein [Patescibacteria group bacterium]MBU1727699.1 hypothetical protein [Patescibacteria group bacterium]
MRKAIKKEEIKSNMLAVLQTENGHKRIVFIIKRTENKLEAISFDSILGEKESFPQTTLKKGEYALFHLTKKEKKETREKLILHLEE